MFKNKFALIILLALLVIALAACGDSVTPGGAENSSNTAAANPVGSKTDLPILSSATAVTLPEGLKQKVSVYASTEPNTSFTAYKIGEPLAKVQNALITSFK